MDTTLVINSFCTCKRSEQRLLLEAKQNSHFYGLSRLIDLCIFKVNSVVQIIYWNKNPNLDKIAKELIYGFSGTKLSVS